MDHTWTIGSHTILVMDLTHIQNLVQEWRIANITYILQKTLYITDVEYI